MSSSDVCDTREAYVYALVRGEAKPVEFFISGDDLSSVLNTVVAVFDYLLTSRGVRDVYATVEVRRRCVIGYVPFTDVRDAALVAYEICTRSRGRVDIVLRPDEVTEPLFESEVPYHVKVSCRHENNSVVVHVQWNTHCLECFDSARGRVSVNRDGGEAKLETYSSYCDDCLIVEVFATTRDELNKVDEVLDTSIRFVSFLRRLGINDATVRCKVTTLAGVPECLRHSLTMVHQSVGPLKDMCTRFEQIGETVSVMLEITAPATDVDLHEKRADLSRSIYVDLSHDPSSVSLYSKYHTFTRSMAIDESTDDLTEIFWKDVYSDCSASTSFGSQVVTRLDGFKLSIQYYESTNALDVKFAYDGTYFREYDHGIEKHREHVGQVNIEDLDRVTLLLLLRLFSLDVFLDLLNSMFTVPSN